MPKPSTNSAIIMQLSPHSASSEAYRSLRFNIDCTMIDNDLKTLTITSAGRGEGKTTTALNLAVAYAQNGKKVILIDADLRSPSIHLAFGRENRRGLTSYLAQQSTMNEIVAESYIENLSLIVAGPKSPNPAELLASESMKLLLEELKQCYDMVILDASSVLTLTDAKIIAAQCDGVLLVVHYGKVKRQVALKVKEELALAKARLIGIVLNQTKNQEVEAYR